MGFFAKLQLALASASDADLARIAEAIHPASTGEAAPALSERELLIVLAHELLDEAEAARQIDV